MGGLRSLLPIEIRIPHFVYHIIHDIVHGSVERQSAHTAQERVGLASLKGIRHTQEKYTPGAGPGGMSHTFWVPIHFAHTVVTTTIRPVSASHTRKFPCSEHKNTHTHDRSRAFSFCGINEHMHSMKTTRNRRRIQCTTLPATPCLPHACHSHALTFPLYARIFLPARRPAPPLGARWTESSSSIVS